MNSYMCVLLVEERQEGEKRVREAPMELMGRRKDEEGRDEKKKTRKGVKVGRFPGGPMS